jgi:hypothetical protein
MTVRSPIQGHEGQVPDSLFPARPDCSIVVAIAGDLGGTVRMSADRGSRARVVFTGYQQRAVDRCLAALEADLDAITGRADAAEIELARIRAARLGPVPALVEQLLEAAQATAALLEAGGEAAAERTLAAATATAASIEISAAQVAAARQAEAARIIGEATHFAHELHERVAVETARRRAEAARDTAELRDRSRSDEETSGRELARLRRRRAGLRAHLEQIAAVLHEPTRMAPAAEPPEPAEHAEPPEPAEDLTARAS